MKAEKLFKCLADETRLLCMLLLLHEDELCVCDIVRILGYSQPKISRHLAQLRAAELLLDQRRDQWVFYRLHPNILPWIHEILTISYQTRQEEIDSLRKNITDTPCSTISANRL